MVSGFIMWNIKALMPKLKWIKAVTGDDSAHPMGTVKLGSCLTDATREG
jgi:hypothetical protein